jgi:hypothetical protein
VLKNESLHCITVVVVVVVVVAVVATSITMCIKHLKEGGFIRP